MLATAGVKGTMEEGRKLEETNKHMKNMCQQPLPSGVRRSRLVNKRMFGSFNTSSTLCGSVTVLKVAYEG